VVTSRNNTTTRIVALCLLACLGLILSGCSLNGQKPQQAAVATAHPLATQAAFRVLDRGGNAFDAAIAAASMLAVVEPYGSGLGGGGFWLLQRNNGDAIVIDAREKAPLAAHRDMYLDATGNVSKSASSTNGPLAAAIPGQVAAIDHISREFGNMPLAATLADAIQVADDGFRVTEKYRDMVRFREAELRRHPASRSTFLINDSIPERNVLIKQPQLAETLRQIARTGKRAFYTGELAEKLVDDVHAAGGIWTTEDLAAYETVEREPIRFSYQGYDITTVPPPSSGGIALAQMFGIRERVTSQNVLPEKLESTIKNTEVMRLAYRDRSLYLGDPDFVEVPTDDLLQRSYLAYLARSVSNTLADAESGTTDARLKTPEFDDETHHTTHFSILDGYGNRASVTLSINLPFGSGYTSPQTGILLNNEMDDFSIKPGHPNAYGLVGNEANAIEPGKRPLSSMTPSIVENGERLMITGTPGGSRIISMVFQSILSFIEGKDAQAIVTTPRYHHQFKPDVIQHEPNTFSEEELNSLHALGYNTKDIGREYGNMQIVIWDKDAKTMQAASDPRGIGQAISRQ
jgi:gamma-glutamyltranspeptidase/glutathione hydrolase